MTAPDETPVARARAAALAELRRTPRAVPWRRQAAKLAGAQVGTALLTAGAAVATGIARPGDLLSHAATVGPLLIVGALGAIATLTPRRRPLDPWHLAVLAGAPVVMAALVLARGAGLPSATPAWVCSASHVALGLLPLAFALAGLRQSAWSWANALTAGLGAGTAGALLGELACHRGARHVLVHHVGAWLVIALACVLISRRLRPRAFAP